MAVLRPVGYTTVPHDLEWAMLRVVDLETGEAQTCVLCVAIPAGTSCERHEHFAARDLVVHADGTVTFDTTWGARVVCSYPLTGSVRIDPPPDLR